MTSKAGAAAAAKIDSSKFDFTRWNLDGLPLEGGSATIAMLLQRAMSAPQWPQAIGSNLPAIKTALLQHLTVQCQAIQQRATVLDQELVTRTSDTQAQITALQGKLRAASVPPAVAPDPNKFQFVAKAIDQESQLGLPGLTVQLSEPRKRGKVLARGTTDKSGNAILSLAKDEAERLTNEKMDLTVTILNSAGKTLHTAQNAVCCHANQVQTHVASIATSEDSAAAVQVASRLSARDTALLASLNAKIDQLTTAYTSRKQGLQDTIAQIQVTISAIQEELTETA